MHSYFVLFISKLNIASLPLYFLHYPLLFGQLRQSSAEDINAFSASIPSPFQSESSGPYSVLGDPLEQSFQNKSPDIAVSCSLGENGSSERSASKYRYNRRDEDLMSHKNIIQERRGSTEPEMILANEAGLANVHISAKSDEFVPPSEPTPASPLASLLISNEKTQRVMLGQTRLASGTIGSVENAEAIKPCVGYPSCASQADLLTNSTSMTSSTSSSSSSFSASIDPLISSSCLAIRSDEKDLPAAVAGIKSEQTRSTSSPPPRASTTRQVSWHYRNCRPKPSDIPARPIGLHISHCQAQLAGLSAINPLALRPSSPCTALLPPPLLGPIKQIRQIPVAKRKTPVNNEPEPQLAILEEKADSLLKRNEDVVTNSDAEAQTKPSHLFEKSRQNRYVMPLGIMNHPICEAVTILLLSPKENSYLT
ncbi:unnamed protein product [Protopolystoma xenopodis]|uniref:Uncharacterized protein n=1 Tax=Protopolystoma xenopodis TaxID=117903 RepID=A0A3S4ZYE2_9PLAT|nr:unnamed protein product [Protopolystoma xenopodis]